MKKPLSSAGVTVEIQGLGRVAVAESNPFEDLVDQFVGEENPA